MSKLFLQGGALVPTPDHAPIGANTLMGGKRSACGIAALRLARAEEPTIIGACPIEMLLQRLRHARFNGRKFWNKTCGKIQDLTHQKSKAKMQAAAARRAGVNPYPQFKARLGGVGAKLGAGLRGTEFCLR